jgi:aminoglycoside 2'-N-acetyltransferase I
MDDVELITTDAIGPNRLAQLRAMLAAAYDGEFAPEDFAHACGGVHAWILDAHGVASHAAVVPRRLTLDGRTLDAGYVEAVATRADLRGRGHATMVMARIGDVIQRDFDVGVLSSGLHAFYARLGWVRWQGPSFVERDGRLERTPDDDDGLMILRTSRTPALDPTAAIVAPWREGDVW